MVAPPVAPLELLPDEPVELLPVEELKVLALSRDIGLKRPASGASASAPARTSRCGKLLLKLGGPCVPPVSCAVDTPWEGSGTRAAAPCCCFGLNRSTAVWAFRYLRG